MKNVKLNRFLELIFLALIILIFPIRAKANMTSYDWNKTPLPTWGSPIAQITAAGSFEMWSYSGGYWEYALQGQPTVRISREEMAGIIRTGGRTMPDQVVFRFDRELPNEVKEAIATNGIDSVKYVISVNSSEIDYTEIILNENLDYAMSNTHFSIEFSPIFNFKQDTILLPSSEGGLIRYAIPYVESKFGWNLFSIWSKSGSHLGGAFSSEAPEPNDTIIVDSNGNALDIINSNGDLTPGKTFRLRDGREFSGDNYRVGNYTFANGGATGVLLHFPITVEFFVEGEPPTCPRLELENVSTARPLLPDCCFMDPNFEWSAQEQLSVLDPLHGGRDVAAYDEYRAMYESVCAPPDPSDCDYNVATFCPDCEDPDESDGMARDITDWDCIFLSNEAPLAPSPFDDFYQGVYVPNNPIFSNLAVNPYCDVYCREEVAFVFPDQSVRVDAGFHFVLGDSPAPANVPRWGGIGFEGEVQCQVAKIQEGEQLGDYNDDLHINHPQFVQDWTQANYDVAIAWDDWQKFELEEWAKDSAQYIGTSTDCQYFFSNSGSDQNNSRSRALGCIEEILMWQCNSGDSAADGSGDTERETQFTCRNIRRALPYYTPCPSGYSKRSIYDRTCRSSSCPPCSRRCDRCTCSRTVTKPDGTTGTENYRCTSCSQCGTTCRGVSCSTSAPLAGYDCSNNPGYTLIDGNKCYRDYTSSRNYWQCLAYDYTRFQKVMTPEFEYNDPNVNDSSGQFEWCAVHSDVVPYLWNDSRGSRGYHHREIASSYLSTITSGGVTGVYRQPAGSTANRTPANRTTSYWQGIYEAARTRRTTAENYLNECQDFEFNYAHLEPRLQLHYNDYKYKGTFPLAATSTTNDQLTYFIAGNDIGSSGRLENIDSDRSDFVNPVIRNGEYYERFRCEDRTSPMTPAIWPRVETVVTGEKCVEIEQPYWVNDNFDYYIQKEIRYNLDADTYRYVVKDADDASNSVSLHEPPSGNYTNIGYSNLPVHYIQDPDERMDQLEVMIEFVPPASLAPAGMDHKFDDDLFANPDCTSYTCYIDVIYTLIAELDTLIIFRQVDLENPFVGKSGTGREPGYNWRESASEEFIRNNRGAETYDVYSLEPMYEITLTPLNIAAIKNYNRRTNFADFNLTCTEGSNDGFDRKCISEFLNEFNVSRPSGCSKNNWDC